MSIDRYTVLDSSGTVVNIVLWDGTSTWVPPVGCTVRKATATDTIATTPVVAVVRPKLVQNYAPAERTLGGTGSVTMARTGNYGDDFWATKAPLPSLNDLRDAYENLRRFTEDLAQHHNALINDLRDQGLVG